MKCAGCGELLDVPSEVMRGLAKGVCPFCHHVYGEKPKPGPDMRGAPSRPGATVGS